MKSFSQLSLATPLKNNLRQEGLTEPTPVQAQAIEPALSGRDLVVTAPTGTGKTLAFVLPLIHRLMGQPSSHAGIRAVIVSPTRELSIQIEGVFAKMTKGTGVRVASAVGGRSERPQLQSIRTGAQVLIATPGRLCDFLSRKLVDLSRVRILTLDEADRMLDLGFLPDIKRLMAAMPSDRQTLFFSATIESSVRHLIEAHVRDAVRIEIGSPTKPIERVDLHLYEVEQDRKVGLLVAMLRQEDGSFLVFARTKRGADRLSKKLSREGVKTAAIHGDRSQNQRTQALEGFQTGYYRVLVATDVASRGIHVDGISHVVNYDLPQVPEDFIHRVGRTGRAGARGTASTFATRSERGEVAKIEQTLDTKLVRRQVSSDVPRELRSSAPVFMMPSASRRHGNVRSSGPRGKAGKRVARRAL
jgi:ATP-dependent RNA helicase RhlE